MTQGPTASKCRCDGRVCLMCEETGTKGARAHGSVTIAAVDWIHQARPQKPLIGEVGSLWQCFSAGPTSLRLSCG